MSSQFYIDEGRKIFLYGIIGILGVTTHFILYGTLIFISINYQLANLLGYVSGTFLTFFLNRKYNFKVFDKIIKRMFSFFMIAFFGYLQSAVSLWLLVEQIEMSKMLAIIMTIPIVVIVQYLLNRTITFSEDR